MTCIATHHHRGVECSPAVCRRALLDMAAAPERDRGEREPIPPNSADLVLTPDEWRAKHGRLVSA